MLERHSTADIQYPNALRPADDLDYKPNYEAEFSNVSWPLARIEITNTPWCLVIQITPRIN